MPTQSNLTLESDSSKPWSVSVRMQATLNDGMQAFVHASLIQYVEPEGDALYWCEYIWIESAAHQDLTSLMTREEISAITQAALDFAGQSLKAKG